MVRAHRGGVSPKLEERYRTQLRTRREVMRRLAVDADLPSSLRSWRASQPPDSPVLLLRARAEEVFEPLLQGIDDEDADADGERAYFGDARHFRDDSGDDSSATSRTPEPARSAVSHPVSIFISYSHADKALAQALYEGLNARGHTVWIDEQELRIGDSLIERISTAIAEIDFFLALVSPSAAQSAWCQKELALAVSGELRRRGMRVMPLRVDDAEMPRALGDQLYLEVSLDDVDSAVDRILRDIALYRRESQAAATEAQPSSTSSASAIESATTSSLAAPTPFEPVRIVGVVEQGVGTPLNDGSRGSALYRVPLQLSRQPSPVWSELFKRIWDHPPSFTTMHRPGIGSVQGDTIVLDGTSMDELENVHLDTLRAVMEKTNAEAAELHRREQEARQREDALRPSHEETVRDVARRLRFD
jgi:hypothetical protein